MTKIAKHIVAGALAGSLAGLLCGTAELLEMMSSLGAYLFHGEDKAQILLVYAVHWAILTGALALLLGILAGRKHSFAGLLLRYSLLTLIFQAVIYLVFKTLTQWFENFKSPAALGTVGGTVLGGLILAVLVLRYLPRLSRRSALWFSLGVPALCAVLIPLSLVWGSAGVYSRDDGGAPPRFNVLVMLVDTLRADHLGAYGYDRAVSPAIDRLASEGVLFESCIASSSWTRPSTSSLLTGMFPMGHNQTQLFSVLPPGSRLMPDAMGEYGYRTAFLAANTQISRGYGFAQDVDFYHGPGTGHNCSFFAFIHAVNQVLQKKFKIEAFSVTSLFHAIRGWTGMPAELKLEAADLNRDFLDWLGNGDEGPFFAYMHYMEPHAPYRPEAPFDTRFVDPGYNGPRLDEPPATVGKKEIPPLSREPPLDAAQTAYLTSQYDGEVATVDRAIGSLLDTLRERGLYDNTLVVFTADHGEMFYDHGAWKHGHSLYQELIRIPLIMKFPGPHSARRGTS